MVSVDVSSWLGAEHSLLVCIERPAGPPIPPYRNPRSHGICTCVGEAADGQPCQCEWPRVQRICDRWGLGKGCCWRLCSMEATEGKHWRGLPLSLAQPLLPSTQPHICASPSCPPRQGTRWPRSSTATHRSTFRASTRPATPRCSTTTMLMRTSCAMAYRTRRGTALQRRRRCGGGTNDSAPALAACLVSRP